MSWWERKNYLRENLNRPLERGPDFFARSVRFLTAKALGPLGFLWNLHVLGDPLLEELFFPRPGLRGQAQSSCRRAQACFSC